MRFRRLALAAVLLFVVSEALGQTTTRTTLSVTAGGSNITTVRQGTAVTLIATVSSAGGGPATAPGQVSFCEVGQQPRKCADINLLATVQLGNSGTAVYKFFPGAGSHTYQATFLGTHAEAASASISSVLAVNPYYPTTTALTAVSTPAGYTLTATVTGTAGTVPPTGTVSFEDASNGNYVLGTATLVPGTTTGTGGLTLATSQVLNTQEACLSAAVADVNGDGKPDLLLGIFGFDDYGVYVSTIAVFLGNGDGTFNHLVSIPTPLGVTSIAVADVNGDGKPDLVAFETLAAYAYAPGNPPPNNANLHPLNTVQVLLGKGDGTFSFGQAIENPNSLQMYPGLPDSVGGLAPFAAKTVAIGDFNGDGIADFVLAGAAQGTVKVYFGNGDGTFMAGPVTQAGLDPLGIAVGDFNGDGKADLAVSEPVVHGSASTNVFILLGNCDGTFTAAPSLTGVGTVSSDIATGDFNGDGFPDVAVETVGSPGWVNVYLGHGDGTFTEAPHSPIRGTAPQGSLLAVGDFNGDGIDDMVTSSFSNADSLPVSQGYDTLSFLLGNGDGTFQPPVNAVAADYFPYAISAVALGDFTGSGLSGIASADNASRNAYILQPHAAAQTTTATTTLAGLSFIGSGNHNVIAVYSGDSTYQPSTSPPVSLAAEQELPTVTLTLSPTTTSYGQTVSMTATITPNTVQGHDATGSITFSVASRTLGTVPVVNGVATFSSNLLPIGTDTVAAIYSGDAYFATTGGSATEVVTGFNSVSVLTPTPNPSFVGQTVTLTAAVSGVGSTTVPTGVVIFYDSATIIGRGTLDATGHATLTTSTLSLGAHDLSFVYPGDLGYLNSTSPTVRQIVTAQGSTTTLTVAPNPAGVGQPVTLTAGVTLSNTGAAPGIVSFYDGLTLIGQATLDATGHATYTTSTLALGTHSLTAVYPGSLSFGGSTSLPVSESIQLLNFSITLTNPSVTLQTGQHTTTSVVLTSIGNFADNITITCGTPPAYVTCMFTPTPAALTGNGTATVSFYLDTDSIVGGTVNGPIRGSLAPQPTSTRLALLLSPFTLLTLLTRRRSQRLRRLLLLLILTLPTTLLVTSCASSIITPIPSAAPGTYTIPITATGASSNIAHTANLTLQITP
jgi:hypothetical protein